MKHNLVEVLEKKGFSPDQIHEIQLGLEEKLDVTCYASKDYLAI